MTDLGSDAGAQKKRPTRGRLSIMIRKKRKQHQHSDEHPFLLSCNSVRNTKGALRFQRRCYLVFVFIFINSFDFIDENYLVTNH